MGAVQSDSFGKEREVSIKVKRSKSLFAVWSRRFSLLFFVPFAPALGMLLGLVGMRSIKSNPARTGKSLAAFGAFFGFVFTAGQAWVGWSAYQFYEGVSETPAAALEAGFHDDYAGMLDRFTPDADRARGNAAPFVRELSNRYGSFRGVASSTPAWEWRPGATLDCTFMFETGHVDAEIEWAFEFAPTGYEAKIASLTITDPRYGDLSFPDFTTDKNVASASDE